MSSGEGIGSKGERKGLKGTHLRRPDADLDAPDAASGQYTAIGCSLLMRELQMFDQTM